MLFCVLIPSFSFSDQQTGQDTSGWAFLHSGDSPQKNIDNHNTTRGWWPDVPPRDQEAENQRRALLVQRSSAYAALARDECGRIELAGESVAVPFVGTTAASFVLAEALRLFHGGPAYTDLKLRLSVPGDLRAISPGRYSAHDAAMPFARSA